MMKDRSSICYPSAGIPAVFLSVCRLATGDCHAEIMRVIFLDIDGVLVTRRPCIMEETLC